MTEDQWLVNQNTHTMYYIIQMKDRISNLQRIASEMDSCDESFLTLKKLVLDIDYSLTEKPEQRSGAFTKWDILVIENAQLHNRLLSLKSKVLAVKLKARDMDSNDLHFKRLKLKLATVNTNVYE